MRSQKQIKAMGVLVLIIVVFIAGCTEKNEWAKNC